MRSESTGVISSAIPSGRLRGPVRGRSWSEPTAVADAVWCGRGARQLSPEQRKVNPRGPPERSRSVLGVNGRHCGETEVRVSWGPAATAGPWCAKSWRSRPTPCGPDGYERAARMLANADMFADARRLPASLRVQVLYGEDDAISPPAARRTSRIGGSVPGAAAHRCGAGRPRALSRKPGTRQRADCRVYRIARTLDRRRQKDYGSRHRGGRIAPRRHKSQGEPSMRELALADRVEVLVLVDNVTDNLSTVPEFVEHEFRRFWKRGGRILSGQCLCCAAHGLSCAITAWRGDIAKTLLFDTGPDAHGVREKRRHAWDSIWALWTVSFSRTGTGITAAPCSARWR